MHSRFHSRALHLTGGRMKGEKTSCSTVLRKWMLLRLIYIQLSHEFCGFSEWSQLYLPCQRAQIIFLQKIKYLNCSETSHFQKSFAWSRKMGEQGRAWQQTVTRGNQGITHSYLKTVTSYYRTARVCSLSQSLSPAPMSSLLKSNTLSYHKC